MLYSSRCCAPRHREQGSIRGWFHFTVTTKEWQQPGADFLKLCEGFASEHLQNLRTLKLTRKNGAHREASAHKATSKLFKKSAPGCCYLTTLAERLSQDCAHFLSLPQLHFPAAPKPLLIGHNRQEKRHTNRVLQCLTICMSTFF